jgi:LacI family transcriptional regulator
VSNRCTEAGRIAVDLLMDLLRTRTAGEVRHVLDTHLVIRSSTAPPPRASGLGRRSRQSTP